MVSILFCLRTASYAYRIILTGSTFLSRQHVSMHIRNHRLGIRNHRVGIDRELGLKGGH
jgi:hypothetical protein